jgi:arabinofuranosyltransferase
VFFTNLGMVGMNVGLDVRVIDQIGLANPLAQHTERLKHGRIGHDKNLFPDWVIADGPWVKLPPGIPGYLDPQWVAEAVSALQCPETKAVLSSVRAPMTPHRFLSNLVNSFEFTKYRIDRVPRYELARCGLPIPEEAPPPPRE